MPGVLQNEQNSATRRCKTSYMANVRRECGVRMIRSFRFKCVCVLGKNNLHIRTQQKKQLEAKKKDMQCMHKRNSKAPLCNHSCRKKAVSITYCECVLVALVTVHAMRVHHIVTSDCAELQSFFHIISQTALFSKKKNY